jgi:hypothetical protein
VCAGFCIFIIFVNLFLPCACIPWCRDSDDGDDGGGGGGDDDDEARGQRFKERKGRMPVKAAVLGGFVRDWNPEGSCWMQLQSVDDGIRVA